MTARPISLLFVVLAAAAPAGLVSAQSDSPQPLRTGAAATGDWRADAPGVRRELTPADLPAPFATASARANAAVVPRPAGAELHVPPGFTVAPYVTGLQGPRMIRTAPNGDIFVAETRSGRLRVLRGADGAAAPATNAVFAEGLKQPFGIAFYPAGPNPKWVYVAQLNSVIRYPYRNGDLAPRGPSETVVATLTTGTGGHSTRDLAFTPDGRRLLVSVGSGSNVAEQMPKETVAEAQAWQKIQGLGAAWGPETDRADVLAFSPEGGPPKRFATGIRNCVSLAIHPETKDVWCATNERDGLGDDLVPDYVTRVREGAFYGWPWYYLGDHVDPRRKDERPDLAGHVTVPDVLIQSHSAPLGMVFYPEGQKGPAAFPRSFGGDALVALHGSWNRAKRTGYKVVRVRLDHGVPTGEYDDFLVGFVADDAGVWGRPVATAVAHDGALLVSDDGGGVIWRVAGPGAPGR